jgi:uncharacterized integral membrane protein
MTDPANRGLPHQQPGSDPLAPIPAMPAAPATTPARSDETSSAGAPPVTTPATAPPGLTGSGKVRSGRVSSVWVGLILAALVLVLLVIFIAQNSSKVSIHFLGFHGHFSLALALLVSSICGALLVAVPGVIRILQLRRSLRLNAPGAKGRSKR